MRIVRAADFTGVRAWDADLIATIGGATATRCSPSTTGASTCTFATQMASTCTGWRSVTCSTPTSGWNTSPTRVGPSRVLVIERAGSI